MEVPLEPVPMADRALQVTEEDIRRSMGPGSGLKSLSTLEDQNHNVDLLEHPLKILSQSNLTVVSTFTGKFSDLSIRCLRHKIQRTYTFSESENFGSVLLTSEFIILLSCVVVLPKNKLFS